MYKVLLLYGVNITNLWTQASLQYESLCLKMLTLHNGLTLYRTLTHSVTHGNGVSNDIWKGLPYRKCRIQHFWSDTFLRVSEGFASALIGHSFPTIERTAVPNIWWKVWMKQSSHSKLKIFSKKQTKSLTTSATFYLFVEEIISSSVSMWLAALTSKANNRII